MFGDFLFLLCYYIFVFVVGFFNSHPQFWEKFHSVPGAPKQSCSALQSEFLLEALHNICGVPSEMSNRIPIRDQISIYVYHLFDKYYFQMQF